jgi:hypothetical protein
LCDAQNKTKNGIPESFDNEEMRNIELTSTWKDKKKQIEKVE